MHEHTVLLNIVSLQNICIVAVAQESLRLCVFDSSCSVLGVITSTFSDSSKIVSSSAKPVLILMTDALQRLLKNNGARISPFPHS